LLLDFFELELLFKQGFVLDLLVLLLLILPPEPVLFILVLQRCFCNHLVVHFSVLEHLGLLSTLIVQVDSVQIFNFIMVFRLADLKSVSNLILVQ
jgi:hypothetical protein